MLTIGENMSSFMVSFSEGNQNVNRSDNSSISGGYSADMGNVFGHHDNDLNFHEYIFTTADYPDISSLVSTSPAVAQNKNGVDTELVKFIVWGIIGSVLAVLGFLGNTLSMVVLHRKQMRSSTSYYLLSLAIYDNCILVGMVVYFCLPALVPYTSFLRDFTSFKSLTIPVGYPLSLSAQMGSIYTCVGFTVERFIAVCRPLHAANTCTKSRTIRAIVLIFIWSVVCNIPRFFHYKFIYEENSSLSFNMTNAYSGNDSNFKLNFNGHELSHTAFLGLSKSSSNIPSTNVILNFSDSNLEQNSSEALINLTNLTQGLTESKNSPSKRKLQIDLTEFGSSPTFKHLYLIYFQLFFMFILPFLVILLMNIGLIRAVRGSKSMQQSMCASARKEHNLTVMLIALIVVFLVCQFPSIIDNILIAVIGEIRIKSNDAYMCFWILCSLMVEINAASNFLLYCFFGKKFRLILLNILGFKKRHHQMSYRSVVSKSQTNGTRTHEMEVSVM